MTDVDFYRRTTFAIKKAVKIIQRIESLKSNLEVVPYIGSTYDSYEEWFSDKMAQEEIRKKNQRAYNEVLELRQKFTVILDALNFIPEGVFWNLPWGQVARNREGVVVKPDGAATAIALQADSTSLIQYLGDIPDVPRPDRSQF